MQDGIRYERYLITRLLESLRLADEACSDEVRAVHLKVSRYYRDLLAPTGAREADCSQARLSADVTYKGVHPATVLKVSTHGFHLICEAAFDPSGAFQIKLNGIDPLRAKIVQVDPEGAACQFVSPIHPALLDAAIASRKPEPGICGDGCGASNIQSRPAF